MSYFYTAQGEIIEHYIGNIGKEPEFLIGGDHKKSCFGCKALFSSCKRDRNNSIFCEYYCSTCIKNDTIPDTKDKRIAYCKNPNTLKNCDKALKTVFKVTNADDKLYQGENINYNPVCGVLERENFPFSRTTCKMDTSYGLSAAEQPGEAQTSSGAQQVATAQPAATATATQPAATQPTAQPAATQPATTATATQTAATQPAAQPAATATATQPATQPAATATATQPAATQPAATQPAATATATQPAATQPAATQQIATTTTAATAAATQAQDTQQQILIAEQNLQALKAQAAAQQAAQSTAENFINSRIFDYIFRI